MSTQTQVSGKWKVLTGNHTVSHAVKLARVQVISAYPITPQTHIVELLSEMVASGELNARFITVESEHSAMAACIGAAVGGVRTFTATSAQGLALMHELLHWAAGARLPIVMVDVNRAMAPPWSIWTDQNDSLSQRDTGWMQVYAESNQEVLDLILQAYRVSEKVLLPTMVVLDAFVLSHTAEPVYLYDQEPVDAFLPPFDFPYKLDLENPRSVGNLADPSLYFEMKVRQERAMQEARRVWREVGQAFGEHFGRVYEPVEAYRTEDAETLFVAVGATTTTVRVAVDRLRDQGEKVGLVKLRLFRPFPFEEIRHALAGAQRVVVLDRNISFGHHGIFYQEIKSALYGQHPAPELYGTVIGLGGREVTVDTVIEIYGKLNTWDPRDPLPHFVGARMKEEGA